MIMVGGPADRSEPYAKYCAERLDALRAQFPGNFWADPGAFFTNGTLVLSFHFTLIIVTNCLFLGELWS